MVAVATRYCYLLVIRDTLMVAVCYKVLLPGTYQRYIIIAACYKVLLPGSYQRYINGSSLLQDTKATASITQLVL